MKKLLSVVLALVLLLSCVYTCVGALDNSIPVGTILKQGEGVDETSNQDPNKAIVNPENWNSTWRLQGASVNITSTTEGKDGSTGIKVDTTLWRDTFVKLTLQANAKYDFAFNYKGSGALYALMVFAVNDIDSAKWGSTTERVELALKTGANPIFSEIVSGKFDNSTWNEFAISFETNENTEYYIVLYHTSGDGFVASNFNFTATGGSEPETPDPNQLNDAVMKSLTWKALWGSITLDPKKADLDKSESFSGNSYAMSWGENSRYRDNYTVITLKPNTEYDFSFRYKAASVEEIVHYIGFIPASKTNFSTIKGDRIVNHLTDASTPILGKGSATIEKDTNGVWNLVSTTFKTGEDTNYVFYMGIGAYVDGSFSTMTFSDFNLVEKEPDPNQLNDAVMKSLTWKALWGSITLDPKKADLDKSASFSGNSYAMSWGDNARYRDNYTIVTLKPNTEYDFSFYYKAADVEEIVHYIGFVPTSKTNFSTIKGDHIENHLTSVSTPILGKDSATVGKETKGVWNLVSTTFKTGEDTDYVLYMGIGAYVDGSFSTMTFSDFNLVEKEPDPNQLSDAVMKSLTWKALWGSITLDPKKADLDKSESFSGNSYAMSWGDNARYRDNFTTVTLKPNTEYDFSFYYKAADVEEIVHYIGFVPESKTDFSTIKGDHIEKHLTSVSTPILGKDSATVGKETKGVWNLVSTTFTTGEETEYVFYMGIGAYVDGSFSTMTFSDFNLVEKEPDKNQLSDAVMKSLTWKALWGSITLDPKKADLDKSESFSGNSYAMSWGDNARYRDNYTTVALKPNTIYNFSFRYKSGSTDEVISGIGFVDASKVDLNTIKGDRINNHLTDSSAEILGATNANIGKEVGGVWNLVSTTFKTGEATKYVMYLAVDEVEFDASFNNIILSDFNMVEGVEEDLGDVELPDPENILDNTKPSDWTSSWNNMKGVASGNGISLEVAWRSGYTKVTLKPNVSYKFKFDFENVKVTDIRVYDAAEITNLDTQMLSEANGGAAQGGKNNIAADAISSTCATPKLGETYTAYEIFTTTSATEYYIIFDTTEFVKSAILLKKISLKKYFDPATDVYGTLRTGMGGSIENKGKQAYTNNKDTTITATPLEGNTFEGWFDAAGNKVSEDAKYTFTVNGDFDLTAKFSGSNMPYVDWMKENGMDGTFETGSMVGWYAVDEGTGVVAQFAVFEPSTSAYNSGKKSFSIRARYQHSYFHFNDLAKESNYYLSFYIYCPDDTTYDSSQEIGKQGFKMNEMYVKVGDDTIWSKSNQFKDGDKAWHKLEFFFNTGNADSATLCLNYYGDSDIAEKSIFIDDVNFIQYVADDLDNGDFEEGNNHWMGKYTLLDEIGNKTATISKGEKLYQSVDVNAHSLYTVSFKAKGQLKAAATQINKYSTNPSDLVSSVTNVTTSGEWNEYTFDVYTGMNSAINLVFEALADGAMVDDITIIENEDSTGAVLEKIDFETERFAIKNSTTNTDVYEVYEGVEFAHSGNKSLHFKYSAADRKTAYNFQESYISFQISNRRVYKLSFYYKTTKGNAIKISPDYLGAQAGAVGVKHTAAGDGWYKVEFFASSSTAVYFDPIIANIIGKTKADFYIDDITYTIISAAVLDSNIDKLYAEPPIGLLYNEGFEKPVTEKDWGTLPTTMQIVEGDTQFGNKFLRVKGKTFYVLPVSVEAGAQYCFTVSLRGRGGYLGLSTTADGKGLFAGVSGEVESFISANSSKWVRDGFKFSAPMSGTIYLVIAQESGSMDVDNVLIYKENYALEKIPYGHDVLAPYDYEATTGENYILNGGWNADDNFAEDGSPATGDTFPTVTIVLITLLAAVVMLISGHKNKKEAE